MKSSIEEYGIQFPVMHEVRLLPFGGVLYSEHRFRYFNHAVGKIFEFCICASGPRQRREIRPFVRVSQVKAEAVIW
jgi:hypothetical protein